MKAKSLKAEYQPWLLLLLTADVVLVLWLLVPSFTVALRMMQGGDLRIVTTVLLPVGLLLFVNLLPHKLKAMLVFWRRWGWLPGCEAFSRYGPADMRIDMAALGRNIGKLPDTPAGQNARWYRLFKRVENRTEVREAHRSFLMYRDMSCISLILLLIGTVCLSAANLPLRSIALFGCVLAVQYLLMAVNARWSGGRFVCTVLALHSAEKVTGSRRPKPAA